MNFFKIQNQYSTFVKDKNIIYKCIRFCIHHNFMFFLYRFSAHQLKSNKIYLRFGLNNNDETHTHREKKPPLYHIKTLDFHIHETTSVNTKMYVNCFLFSSSCFFFFFYYNLGTNFQHKFAERYTLSMRASAILSSLLLNYIHAMGKVTF